MQCARYARRHVDESYAVLEKKLESLAIYIYMSTLVERSS